MHPTRLAIQSLSIEPTWTQHMPTLGPNLSIFFVFNVMIKAKGTKKIKTTFFKSKYKKIALKKTSKIHITSRSPTYQYTLPSYLCTILSALYTYVTWKLASLKSFFLPGTHCMPLFFSFKHCSLPSTHCMPLFFICPQLYCYIVLIQDRYSCIVLATSIDPSYVWS